MEWVPKNLISNIQKFKNLNLSQSDEITRLSTTIDSQLNLLQDQLDQDLEQQKVSANLYHSRLELLGTLRREYMETRFTLEQDRIKQGHQNPQEETLPSENQVNVSLEEFEIGLEQEDVPEIRIAMDSRVTSQKLVEARQRMLVKFFSLFFVGTTLIFVLLIGLWII